MSMSIMRARVIAGAALFAASVLSVQAWAQAQLPAPSRVIYKCKVNGAVSYSDEPCVGAQRLDATPVSGVSHLSGAARTGKDVANERSRESYANALKPLTGMSAAQLATATRRNQLDSGARRECTQLEPAILELEQAERRAGAATLKPIQQELFTLRKRYKTLAC
jgi:hypothetical protein